MKRNVLVLQVKEHKIKFVIWILSNGQTRPYFYELWSEMTDFRQVKIESINYLNTTKCSFIALFSRPILLLLEG